MDEEPVPVYNSSELLQDGPTFGPIYQNKFYFEDQIKKSSRYPSVVLALHVLLTPYPDARPADAPTFLRAQQIS